MSSQDSSRNSSHNAPHDSLLDRTRAAPGFGTPDFLRLIEACGLSGSWRWSFATGEQAWSPGLFDLLRIEPTVRPSYDLILSLVHPEDRPSLESAAEVARGRLGTHTVRVIRPDGSLRVLSSRGEVFHGPDGRPRAAAGLLLDVTDQERLTRARQAERRRRRALFEQTRSWTHAALYAQGRRAGSAELLSLTGLSQEAFQADCAQVVVREDRARMRERIGMLMAAGRPFEIGKRLILAEGGHDAFRFVYAPVRNEAGGIETWATLAARADGVKAAPLDGPVLDGLVGGVEGAHLRAARALLGWSMTDLSRASGVSLSTIRRLEEADRAVALKSRRAAVTALRQAGIGFLLTEGNALAVVKR